jgi:hypothetical protein
MRPLHAYCCILGTGIGGYPKEYTARDDRRVFIDAGDIQCRAEVILGLKVVEDGAVVPRRALS